jgi:hypothetical protein
MWFREDCWGETQHLNIKKEVREMNNIATDRKQIFGAEKLTDEYLGKIQTIFEQRIREMTKEIDNTVTAPLSQWVS